MGCRGARKGTCGEMRKKVLAVFGVLLALALALAGTPRPVAAEPPAQGQIPNEMKVVRTFGGKQVEDSFNLMGSYFIFITNFKNILNKLNSAVV